MRASGSKLGIGFLMVTCAACAHAPPPAGRYLYRVTCDAEIARFDTVEKRRTDQYPLATRPGADGLIPVPVGVLEVCLANGILFDPVASTFYTIVPTHLPRGDALELSYRLLSFSVPSITLTAQASAGNNLEHPPRLELAAGQVRVVSPDQPLVTDIDLSGFAPEHHAVPNRIIESSGERVLLSLSEKGTLVFAVADRRAKTLVRLQHIPRTDHNSIHLSPGGTVVLVEEISEPGRPAPKTGRLVIFDTGTGGIVKALYEPRIIGLFYHGMSPTGVALYQDSKRDELISLGMTFPAEAVVVSPLAEFAANPAFFADR
jgi:hypothetical protein